MKADMTLLTAIRDARAALAGLERALGKLGQCLADLPQALAAELQQDPTPKRATVKVSPEERVLTVIRNRGGMDGSTFVRATQFLRRAQRTAILRDLEDRGLVSIEQRGNGKGRPGVTIRATSASQ